MIRKYFLNSEFAKNAFIIFSGATLAQVITIIVSPLLTRLFTPEDFGIFALYSALSATLAVLATGRYQLAVLLPFRDKHAFNVVILSLIFTLGISILTLFFIIFFKMAIIDLLDARALGNWIYVIPLSILLLGIPQVLSHWMLRMKQFKVNSYNRIAQSSVTSLLSIITGLVNAIPGGLIISQIGGQFISVVHYLPSFFKELNSYRKDVHRKILKAVSFKYKDLFLVNTPHALLDTFLDQGIVLFIAFYFTSAITGFYFFAFRILKAPVGLIGHALGQVFFQKVSYMYSQEEDISGLVLKMYKKLFFIGLPFFLLLFFTVPYLFPIIFGKEWFEAGIIAQIITPWLFFNFMLSPVSSLTVILGKQKMALLFGVIDMIIRIVGIMIGGVLGSYKIGFIIMSAGGSLLLIYGLYWHYTITLPKGKNN